MFAQYTHQPPLISGLVGTVEGLADDNGEEMLKMKFPILMDAVLDIKLEHLSREKPPPADIRWVLAGMGAFFLCVVVAIAAMLYFAVDEDPAAQRAPEEEGNEKKEQ